MQQVILDTSFILTCIKQKIDFFDELYLEGYKMLIPRQVIDELKGLEISNSNARLALVLIDKNKGNIKFIDLKSKNVDRGIINYSSKHAGIIIASLDKEIKKKTKNKKLIIRGEKTIGTL